MAAATSSMTGFARSEGVAAGLSWAWELRSVNGRGLELRFRLPGGFDGLEPVLKELAAKTLKRGNVTANLTVKREEAPKMAADPVALQQVLGLALELMKQIPGAEPPRAEALLALPGVLRTASAVEDEAVLKAQAEAVRAGFVVALEGLAVARRGEGARLAAILGGQLEEVAALCARSAVEAADQPAMQRARMLETVRALLAEGENIGRRFDFLVQEFNREANTLCSKSASVALTATGLKLKATIEQLREQVQNVE